jgi:hypothetical protein
LAHHLIKTMLLSLCLLWPACSSANQDLAKTPPERKSTLRISLEAGPDFKILSATDDNKKLILSGVSEQSGDFFHEASFGGWIGKDSSPLTMYSVGFILSGLFAHVGYGYIGEKNTSLGSHWQFMTGVKYIAGPLFIAFKHFSNGSKMFNHSKTPNKGLNFFTLGVTL